MIIDPHAYGLTLAVPEGPARRTYVGLAAAQSQPQGNTADPLPSRLVLLAKAISALSYGGLSDKQPEMCESLPATGLHFVI